MFYPTNDLKDNELMLILVETTDARPDRNWLPAYFFDICLLDGTKIGYCDLRIGHNDNTYIGGNIGYGIYEPYRGHHFASKACQLLFRQARKHDMDYVIITCSPENIASAKTCETAGGIFVETANIPEDNKLYKDGMRVVNIYRFDI